jgi:predicted GNAT family N-acyltransferase
MVNFLKLRVPLCVREQDCFVPKSDSKDPAAKSSSIMYIYSLEMQSPKQELPADCFPFAKDHHQFTCHT